MRHWRTNLICILFLLVGMVILSRLVFLQIIQHNFYKALAKGQQEIFESLLGARGEIFLYDKDEPVLVAGNKDWYFVYASPKEIENVEEAAEVIAEGLSLDKEELIEEFKKDSLFFLLRKELSNQEIEFVENLGIKGIYLDKERYRYYPHNELAGDVLGFVNTEGKGVYGVEGYLNDILSGQTTWIRKKINPFGYPTEKNLIAPQGGDVYLTIDENIQIKAEKLLEKAEDNLNIEGGQIIVVNPNDGRIIALADYPNFNPNNYEDYSLEMFKNSAVQNLFEPGSMFKAITMAAALNQGKVTPETTYTDEGFVKVGGHTLYNYKGKVYGESTMSEVLEKSINTGAVFAASQIGDKVFLKYIERFGIFEKTGIELQGEAYSKNSHLRKGYKANCATAAFGQGIEMTALNFVRAFSILANGGKLIDLNIIDKIEEDGEVIEFEKELLREEIVSEETLDLLVNMLVGVTEKGFGKRAGVPGYYVAGKTGTSQIPYTNLGIDKLGYSDKTWQSFIGFFPAYEPQFLILVKLDNPETDTAEYSAAPIFGELAQYIVNYYQIPPDYLD